MAKKDWCPRQTFYRLAATEPSDPHARKFSFQLENIFGEGNEIHEKWQTWLWDMGRLWGHWKCISCGTVWYATSPKVCIVCEKPTVKYDEVPLSAEADFLIAGHADGAIPDIGSFIELKTVGMGTLRMEDPALLSKYQVETTDGKKIYDLDALWKGLRRPLPSHIRQGNIYLWLASQMGDMATEYHSMVYIYEFKANQSVKEFTVKYAPDIVEPLIDKALDIKFHLKHGTTPPRPEHVDGPETKVCQSCQFRTLCWELPSGTRDSTTDTERDASDGHQESGGKASARTTRARHADASDGGTARTAGRPHRTRRQSADDSVQPQHEVVRVDRDTASSGRGRREVRRVRTRQVPSA
jgi:CRISPR/Cas system-associated exonuclease Cas4 (RecB family)